MTRAPLPLLIALLAGGCAPPLARVQLTDGSCGAPAADQANVRVLTLFGDGLAPRSVVLGAEGSRQEVSLALPPGTGRWLELRAYDGDPNGSGRLVALGRSTRLDVAEGAAPVVRVVVRPVEIFVPFCDAAGQPRALGSPRAGHSATALPDGRVFLAGGYQLGPTGQAITAATTELLDPAAGTLSPWVPLGLAGGAAMPRAFHAAALLGGKVLLAGGEAASGSTVTPLTTALAVDVSAQRVEALSLQLARTRGAAVAAAGRLLLVGGAGSQGPTAQPEQIKPDLTSSRVSVSLARAGAAAAPLSPLPSTDGGRVAVIGGFDGQAALADVAVLAPEGDRFVLQGGPSLRQPRLDAAVAGFADGSLLVLGGRSSAAERPFVPVDVSERVTAQGHQVTVTPGPFTRARSGGCAVTLADGRVLWMGGKEAGPTGAPVSSGAVERLTLQADGKVTVEALVALDPPRHDLACAPLADGSVLVTGGVSQRAEKAELLADAVVLMPAPP